MRTLLCALLLLGVSGSGPGAGAVAIRQDIPCTGPGCKAKLKADAKFCTECGTQVPQKECAGCKKPMRLDAKFCTGCGTKVEEKPAPPPPPKKDPVPPPPAEKKDPAPAEKKPEPPQDPKKVGQDQDPDKVKEKRGQELEKFGVTADQINKAIDRGAAYLASRYAKWDPGQPEDFAIAYALIHTSVWHTNSKVRGKLVKFLKDERWLKQSPYVIGLRALALEATRDPELRPYIRQCAEYLIESQGPHGTWTYNCDMELTTKIPAEKPVEDISVSGGEPLDEEIKGEEMVRNGIAKKGASDGDNSVTQFAVLGLHAASKAGFRIPKETWQKCHDETLKRQCKDGGWHYHASTPGGYGSMTSAGICTLAICRYYLGDKDYVKFPAVQGGIKWLASNFTVTKNPKENSWAMYYLYSLERVGVLCDTEMIGDNQWYPLGAKHLVDTQLADGAWKPPSEDKEVSTAFALLFLTRATAPVSKIKRGGKGVLETHALNDANNVMFILDASGSMREEMDGREKFDIAKEVVETVVKKLPEGAHLGLRVYGHRFTSLDDKAETDSELVIPLAPINYGAFLGKVRALRCKGKTPITHSLSETVRDISGVDPEMDLMTILLTDGGESTRGAKPADAAAKLVGSRKGMKLHVVGFDINQDDWKEQLEAVAVAGRGRYFHAMKAKDLMESLALAMTGAGEYTLLDKEGKEISKGKFGDRHELPEGKYKFVTTTGGKNREKTVWINTDGVTHVTVRPPRQ